MKKFLVTAILMSASLSASANCFGSGNFYTCTDDSGNSYTVNKMGSSTYVQGNNAATGSSWSQETHRNGGTSQTYGRDADGNSWNSTTYKTPGGGSTTYGTDSNGNPFSRTCNRFGCY